MAPVHTMSCVMGEEPELREPLSFIMGGEYASPFFPEGDTISVCCIYIIEKNSLEQRTISALLTGSGDTPETHQEVTTI